MIKGKEAVIVQEHVEKEVVITLDTVCSVLKKNRRDKPLLSHTVNGIILYR